VVFKLETEMKAIAIGLSAAAVLLLLTAYLYSLRYIFQYKISDGILRVELFGRVPLRRVRLEDIQEARIISPWPFSEHFSIDTLFAEAWPSRVFIRKGVLIRKKRGLSRRLVLTPQDPTKFIDVISPRVSHTTR